MSGLNLVTGGAGFIGSHLVEQLVRLRRPVRIFDDFSTGLEENLKPFPSVEIVRGSLTDPHAVFAAMDNVETVFHLGAMASVAKSLEDPIGCHEVCATGTLNVLEAARRANARRVVYAASSSAYGSASDPAGQCETTPLNTLSPYATAKLSGEFYCQAFASSYGLETVRLRFFNIFGPRQRADSPYSGVIAIFIAALAAGRTPIIHGDGGQTRDFTYVANAVSAMLKASEAPGVSGQVFNVGTGAAISVLDLVNCLNRLLDTNILPRHEPARVGDVRTSRANIQRIRESLNYEPLVNFEDGLRHTLAWYQSVNAEQA